MGSIATRVRVLEAGESSNYPIAQDDNVIVVSILSDDKDAEKNLYLPPADSSLGRHYTIKRAAALDKDQEVYLLPDPVSGDLIDGKSDFKIDKEFGVATVVSDGSNWYVTSAAKEPEAQAVSEDYTLAEAELVGVEFTEENQTITLTLPLASTRTNRRYIIKRNTDGVLYTGCKVVLALTESETLDQFTSYEMTNDWETVSIQSTGDRWLILGSYGHTP